jgi:hypothetical protein
MMNPYFTEAVEEKASQIWTFEGLGRLNLQLMREMSETERGAEISMVSGPISTGGVGHVEGNLEIFQRTIDVLQDMGIAVYDQLPFIPHLRRIRDATGLGENALLDGFYLPIFKSGLLKHLNFIRGWSGSFGSGWEYWRAGKHNIASTFLPENFLKMHADVLNAHVLESGTEM